MNAPGFLRKQKQRAEPVPPVTPQPVSPEVQAFIDMSTRQREDLQYFQLQCQHLENELKLTQERLRSTEIELQTVKADKDFLQRHDASMLTGLHDIKVLINATEQRALASAVAPPPPPADHSERDIAIVDGMTEKLTPKDDV
jgi:hypothetical protein